MKITCEDCETEASGRQNDLTKAGWKMLEAKHGKKKIIIAKCPNHSKNFSASWKKILASKFNLRPEDLEIEVIK